MKTAKLEALGTEVPLKFLQEYEDMGIVDDLGRVLEDLAYLHDDFGYVKQYQYQNSVNNVKGVGAAIEFKKGIFPFYKSNLYTICEEQENDADNTFIRGHEETHIVVDRLQKLNLFEEKLSKAGIKTKASIKDLEVHTRANLGGAYAMLRKGHKIGDLNEKFKEDIRTLLKIALLP